ncbi:MAG: helix-turn-helix domain-containing protein, partial [Bacteroidota bacterium]
TSHIPVLLLTARTLIDDRLEGLKIGADDYLTKPFHPNELQLKVRNILKQRQVMRGRFSEEKEFSPKDVTVTSSDEKFLEDLIELVEANIGNPDFKIEQFAQELAVSRALLFIKIKALTNMTPKNFLKSFRLKRAMQLLETEKLNVSEIAYAVGFKEPRYFSKVFQKEFGHSPSQFLKNR